MSDIQSELKGGQETSGARWCRCLAYPNMQVRLMSAKYALAVALQAARQAIEAIAAATWPPQRYDARMCLWMID